MHDVSQALLVSEIHLAQGNRPCAQIISSTASREQQHVAAIKLNQTVVFAELGGFRAQPCFNTPHGTQRTGVSGVSFSPDGTYIAAFSSDELYVARVYEHERVGQLKHVAQLASIKSVHWCPHSTALAVCCKQQVDIYLVVLPPPGRPSYSANSSNTGNSAAAAASNPTQQQQQQSAITLAPLQRLPAPRSASAGPRCACWLPRGVVGSPAALLAAWSGDLLMFTWQANRQGVDWARHRVHRFLAGWPGPVRAITAAPGLNSSSSSSSSCGSCLVLGTVDSQLALERSGSSNSGSQIDAELTHLRVAAAAGSSSSSRGDSPLGLLQRQQQQQLGSALSGRALITTLQPDAAPGVGSFVSTSPLSPSAAAAVDAFVSVRSVDAASPYPGVVVSKTSRAPFGHKAAVLNSSNSSGSRTSVLSSLLNIQEATPASNGTCSSSGEPACVCMLELNLAEFLQTSTGSGSSSSVRSDASSSPRQQSVPQVKGLFNRLSASLTGSFSSPTKGSPTAAAAATTPGSLNACNAARPATTATPFSSVMLLPHLPLPDLLAVQGHVAAIGSSRGPPLVALCSFAALNGLQLLQVVTLPLPSPAAACVPARVRLDGLLLTPKVPSAAAAADVGGSQQTDASVAAAAGGVRTHYPVISEGGWPGVVDAVDSEPCGATPSNGSSSSSSSGAENFAGLPDIVALLNCSHTAAQQQPGFASFGGSSAALDKTADTYLVKCRAPQVAMQPAAPPPQRDVQQAVAPNASNTDLVAAAAAAAEGAAAAAAIAVRGAEKADERPEDSIWWRSLERQQAARQQVEQSHTPTDTKLMTSNKLKQQQQQQQQQQPAQQCKRRVEPRYFDHMTRDQRQLQQQQQEVPGRYVRLERRSLQQRQEQQQQQQQQAMEDLEHQHCEVKRRSLDDVTARAASADTECSAVSSSTVSTCAGSTGEMTEPRQQQQQQQQQNSASMNKPVQPSLPQQQQQQKQQDGQPDLSKLLQPSSPQQQDHQKRLDKDDAEFQAAVSRVNKVVAVLSGVQARLEARYTGLETSLECNTMPGQRLAGSDLSAAAAAAGGGGSTGPPTPDAAGSDAAASDIADDAGASACELLPSNANDTCAAAAGVSSGHTFAVRQAAVPTQARQKAQQAPTAATHDALNEFQISIELRLDAMLRLQQQQQQLLEQQLRQNQQQQLLAGVLAGVQTSFERRFDTMQDLMQQMVKQLERLATGMEELEK